MKHVSLSDINPDNLRYYVEEPDKDFSPERNYQILDQILAENDRMQIQLDKDLKKNSETVSDVLAHFAKYKLDKGGDKQLEGYLGKNWMSKIYGDKLIEKIRMRENIDRLNKI